MAVTVRTMLERLPEARTLSRAERKRAIAQTTTLNLAPGEVLFAQGAPPERMALLLSGSLLVTTASSEGAIITLGRVNPGEVIGEMGMLDTAPRSATVTCERQAVLLSLDHERFQQLDREADPILVWMLEIASRSMARRIGAMNDRIAAAAVDARELHQLPGRTDRRRGGLLGWLESLRSKL